MSTEYDVVVLGGGAAGLSAALTLGRARRRVLVVDDGLPRNRFASHMHTVLGHEGLDPAELLERGRAEVAFYGVALTTDRAVDVREERSDDGEIRLRITAASGAELSARAIVLATGLTDRLPEIPGLAGRWGTRVLHCPYCHGWEVRDARLAVLVSSPVGLHQAQLIRQWSERLTVFTGSVDVPAEIAERLGARGIALVPGRVVEVSAADGGSGHDGGPLADGSGVAAGAIAVRTEDGTVTVVDAIFTASAPEPNDGALAGLGLDRTELPMGQGSFLAVDATGRTSHERIWAVGNVTNPALGVAASMGAGTVAGGMLNMALISAEFDAAQRAHR